MARVFRARRRRNERGGRGLYRRGGEVGLEEGNRHWRSRELGWCSRAAAAVSWAVRRRRRRGCFGRRRRWIGRPKNRTAGAGGLARAGTVKVGAASWCWRLRLCLRALAAKEWRHGVVAWEGKRGRRTVERGGFTMPVWEKGGGRGSALSLGFGWTRVERLGHALQSLRQAAGPSGSTTQALTAAATGRLSGAGAAGLTATTAGRSATRERGRERRRWRVLGGDGGKRRRREREKERERGRNSESERDRESGRRLSLSARMRATHVRGGEMMGWEGRWAGGGESAHPKTQGDLHSTTLTFTIHTHSPL
uniref:Uncharacterized protein n=1 Tax=Oryza sativa subsp. japonica TaxID=39947 RepID=Q6K1Z4_ORYSJ|nr:hypothetical protein [Oryza sativa Japonica Group]